MGSPRPPFESSPLFHPLSLFLAFLPDPCPIAGSLAHTLGSLAHASAGSANGANQRSRRQTRRRCRQPSCTIRRIAWCVKSRRDHQAHTWMHLLTNRTTKRRMSGRAAYGSEGGGSVATSTPLVGVVWDHITVPHLPPQPLCSAAVLDARIMRRSKFAHRMWRCGWLAVMMVVTAQ